MSGDISLSHALGGLRIANPDDENESPPSPLAMDAAQSTATTSSSTNVSAAPPPQSSQSSSGTVTVTQQHRHHIPLSAENPANAYPNEHRVAGPPTPGAVPAHQQHGPALSPPQQAPYHSNRLSHRQSMPLAHQAQQQLQYPHLQSTALTSPRGYGPTGRPMSGIYSHPNVSGGSQSSSYSAYRYGDEPPQTTVPAQRSTSRATQPPIQQAGVLSRDSTRTDYLQGGFPPPRRSSRRASPGSSNIATPGAMTGAYPENGPPMSSEDWQERGAAVGVRREVDANGQTVTKTLKKGVKDFEFGRTLGEGSYSTVLAATDRTTLREYAIKVLDKRHIIKEKKVKYVNIEKDTLNRLNDHPGIVRLYYTFQDERSLYFVLDLASNGELLGVLKKLGSFDEECTRYYGSQILDAVDYMHRRGVLHRDLKPENVLLDSHFNVKITDFGTAKILDPQPRPNENGSGSTTGDPLQGAHERTRAVSFVGTAEYVSPELLTAKEGGKPTDLWAFGCIIYQLLSGRPPFKGATEYLTFDKILKLDYTFPQGFPAIARDLVERLLVPDPSKRLTVEHVKNHPFFDGVVWGKGLWKQKAPRLKAYSAPPPEPIRLNPPTSSAPSSKPIAHPPQPRPHPTRVITELAPPSQLDIDWSPVLTRQNERILKLGNLVVTVTAQSHPQALHSPSQVGVRNGESSSSSNIITTERERERDTPRKFSRFFMSSNTTKKRQRLVMVTSTARIIIAASGGDEKKAKMEIDLLGTRTSWKGMRDARGLTVWCVDTREKHILFEPPPSPPPDPDGTHFATQEWLDSLTRAQSLALSTQHTNSSNDAGFSSQISSPSSTLGGGGLSGPGGMGGGGVGGGGGQSGWVGAPGRGQGGSTDSSMLYNDPSLEIDGVGIPKFRREEDSESLMKRGKRWSRRGEKGGLAAVF